MKIMLICMQYVQYEDGAPPQDHSYEWNHFYLGLKPAFSEVVFYDYMENLKRLGRNRMQEDLIRTVKEEQPDVAIFSLYTDQIEPHTVQEIQKITHTFSFFHDDGWRRDFVAEWAPRFDAFTTSDLNGEIKYRARGLDHAIYMPFGVNEHLFAPPSDLTLRYDVTFVGGWHPIREWYLQRLKKEGIEARAFGYGWPGGILTSKEMIRTFAESKINLNLSNSSSWDARYMVSSPRAFRNTLRSSKNVEQLKGRHFEIPSCGGMQLSYYVEGLEGQFQIGKEVAIFTDPRDLVEKTRLYLDEETARQQMAKAGRERVVDEHGYARRFKAAFNRLGWMG